MAPAIFSSNQLRSHFLSSGHNTIWSDHKLQFVDGLDKVSRDHKFSALALAVGSGGCMSQSGLGAYSIRGEKYGLPRGTVTDGFAVVQSGAEEIG